MQGSLVLKFGIILLLLYFVTRDDIRAEPEALLAPEHTFDRALRMLQWPRTLANFKKAIANLANKPNSRCAERHQSVRLQRWYQRVRAKMSCTGHGLWGIEERFRKSVYDM